MSEDRHSIPEQRRVPRHDSNGGASAPPTLDAALTHYRAQLANAVTAHDLCAEAVRLVGGPRATTHGDTTTTFSNIAELWNGYWRIKCRTVGARPTTPFTAHDVGCMMELFKIARRFSGSFNADDYIDAAGYASCTGEIAAREEQLRGTQSADSGGAATHSPTQLDRPKRGEDTSASG